MQGTRLVLVLAPSEEVEEARGSRQRLEDAHFVEQLILHARVATEWRLHRLPQICFLYHLPEMWRANHPDIDAALPV
eukprot:7310290-Heterocapsa_arctica.AAC.1